MAVPIIFPTLAAQISKYIENGKRLFVLLSQMVPFILNLTSFNQQIEAPRQTVLRMCHLLQRAGLLNMLYNKKSSLNQLSKPEKLYMENPNLLYAMSAKAEIGTVKETFLSIN